VQCGLGLYLTGSVVPAGRAGDAAALTDTISRLDGVKMLLLAATAIAAAAMARRTGLLPRWLQWTGLALAVAIARAYRGYAAAHPGLAAASVRAPAPGDAEHEAAGRAAVGVPLAVLDGYASGARMPSTRSASCAWSCTASSPWKQRAGSACRNRWTAPSAGSSTPSTPPWPAGRRNQRADRCRTSLCGGVSI
jgi:hypothetical protein